MTHNNEKYSRAAIVVLALLAVLYTVHVARGVLLPITLAVIFALLLAPVIKMFEAWKIPRSLGSLIVISGGVFFFRRRSLPSFFFCARMAIEVA